MNLELYINNQLANVGEETDISLIKEFQDHSELERKQVEYSYDLDLPITTTNQKIFGYANDLQVKHKFYTVYDAQLYADDILVLDGKFMLTEVKKDRFTGNLYVPSSKSLSDVLGDMNLREIESVELEISNIADIGVINGQTVGNEQRRDVCFPYIVYNFPRSEFGTITPNKYVQFRDFADTTIDYSNMYPSFSVTNLIKTIFKSAGYTVTGNIFNDERFTDMFVTGSFEADDYKEKLNVPQYVKLRGSYYLMDRETNKVSDTLTWRNSSYLPGTSDIEMYRRYYCTDDLMHSCNTVIEATDNTYGLYQASSTNPNIGSITIQKSGWYVINLQTDEVLFRDKGLLEDIAVCSTDANSWHTNCHEIRLVKGNAFSDTIDYYSQFGQAPIVPRVVETKNVDKVTVNGIEYFGWSYANDVNNLRVPKEGGTAVVHDYSDFKTTNFICGTRFGTNTAWEGNGWYGVDSFNQSFAGWLMLNQPNMLYDSRLYKGTEGSWVLPVAAVKGDARMTPSNPYLYKLWDKVAVNLISENAYSDLSPQFNLVNGVESGNTLTFNNWTVATESNIVDTMKFNSTTINNTSGLPYAYGDCSCVYYLKEGDTLNLELLASRNNSLRQGAMYAADGYTHFVSDTMVNFILELGLLTTDESWIPNNGKEVPSDITKLKNKASTNFHQFLPDMSCNDFIEAFLTTFNLRISKTGDKEYSINFSDLRDTSLNTIDLEKFFDSSKVTEKSIDFPSEYSFKFTTDDEEEGYTHGNDSPFNYFPPSESDAEKYEGNKTIVNNASVTNDNEEVESRFSYTWCKTFWVTTKENYQAWLAAGQPSLISWGKREGTYYNFPVIADADVWAKSFSDGKSEADKTSANPRFFYVNKFSYFDIKNYDGTKTISMIIPSIYKNGMVLAYPNEHQRTTYPREIGKEQPIVKGIEETFFDTTVEPSYEVHVDMAMDNVSYSKINENTYIKINGEYFEIIKIDGHSVDRSGDAELVVKAIV